MQNQDFSITFLVEQTPDEVFKAIINVRDWWSEEIEGNSENLNDEFIYHFGNLHYSKHKIIEVVQGTKVVWLTIDSKLTFVNKQDEWSGTKMKFEISKLEDITKLVITHSGLVPELECYDACSAGWTYYLLNSLLPLIKTGIGNPDQKQKI